ncbi:putative Na+/H+ antiporter, may regulate cell volume and cold resistance [Pseudoalteromonas luteoviolacea B = ATCC 29581]|nr:putative Na+/H+ antiporter, may regulate cell volume and cold resistance [Pseudoalteromonas luteoviolacea B = ATCC 29581]
MNYIALAWVGLAVFVYSLSVRQLQRTELTGPMWFVLIGVGLAWFGEHSLSITEIDRQVWQPIVELTLAIFLFTDAAKTRLRVLMASVQLPLRLLLIGLPISVVLATLVGVAMLPLTFVSCVLLAVMISPTDAALCRGFITAKQVPANLREAINVESGLNDGLCVPLFVLALSAIEKQGELSTLQLLGVFMQELGVALILASVLTFIAIWLLTKAKAHHLFARKTSPFLFVGFCVFIYATTQSLGGSGFIATFISGLLFDRFYLDPFKDKLIEEGEHIAELAAMVIWVLFGVVAFTTLHTLTWTTLCYALAAVTLLRVIPVLIALIGYQASWHHKLTLAWFGPRGLASVVFTLMLVESNLPEAKLIADIATCTILLSVFLHGMTTRPISLSFNHISK